MVDEAHRYQPTVELYPIVRLIRRADCESARLQCGGQSQERDALRRLATPLGVRKFDDGRYRVV
jgi:hypothetical protein